MKKAILLQIIYEFKKKNALQEFHEHVWVMHKNFKGNGEKWNLYIMTINFDIFKVQISESVWNFDTCVVQW